VLGQGPELSLVGDTGVGVNRLHGTNGAEARSSDAAHGIFPFLETRSSVERESGFLWLLAQVILHEIVI
jgi:hypothetical protein